MNRRTLLPFAAAAALTLSATPASAPAAKKKPKTPAAWVKAQKDAKALFAVLRRPGRAGDAPPKVKGEPAPNPPIIGSRYLGSIAGKKAYLAMQATTVCLTLSFQGGKATGGKCVPVADVRTGALLPQALQLGNGSVIFVIVVPDGATAARTIAGVSTPLTVKNNAALLSTTANGTVDVTLKTGKVVTARLGISSTPLTPATPALATP